MKRTILAVSILAMTLMASFALFSRVHVEAAFPPQWASQDIVIQPPWRIVFGNQLSGSPSMMQAGVGIIGHRGGFADIARTADTSYTAGLLGCPTSTGKIGNCTVAGAGSPWIGVLAASLNGNAVFIWKGPATVTFHSTTTVAVGDFICIDGSNAGYVVDTTTTQCGAGLQVGKVIVTNATTSTTQPIWVDGPSN